MSVDNEVRDLVSKYGSSTTGLRILELALLDSLRISRGSVLFCESSALSPVPMSRLSVYRRLQGEESAILKSLQSLQFELAVSKADIPF